MYWSLYSPLYESSVISSIILPSYSAFSFNDYDLQDGSVNVTEIDLESPGNIQYVAKDRGLANWATFIDKKHRLRTIRMKGYLIANSRQTVEELADTFKWELDFAQGYLRIKTRGENWRQILASVTSIDMPRAAYQVTKIPFSITFTANDPYFQEMDNQSETFIGVTSASYVDTLTNNGSASMWVKYYIIFGTGNSWVTTLALSANNRTLSIAQAVTDGDIFLLDMENKTVVYNGVRHDYTGTFPDFIPGINPYTLAVNGTHLYNIIAIKTLKYL